MCGRYTLIAVSDLQARFQIAETAVAAAYNIAPTQQVPVIVREQALQLVPMRWGLIPSWAKDRTIGARMINARSETLAEKPAFRGLLRRRRCLVPASGFYEWQAGPGGKQPYYFFLRDTALFAFAGLYDIWRDEQGMPLATFTIITTEANELLRPIHERMPVILQREAEQIWLNPQIHDPAHLQALLTPYPAELMASYRVTKRANSPHADDPGLVEQIDLAG